jgi:hypothetical protein
MHTYLALFRSVNVREPEMRLRLNPDVNPVKRS